MTHIAIHAAVIVTILLVAIPLVISDDTTPVPADKAQLESWFQNMVGPIAHRKATLDPALVTAEDGPPKVTKVRKDGGGEFKTITDAVNSIPTGNTKRVIVWIGAGEYKEKVKIERTKPFVTFYGASNAVPTLTFDGTAAKYGTVDSATLIVESDYFTGINLIVENSAPRPDGKRAGAQAVAMRVSGDKNAFYNTKIIGFQDTICDDRNRHFFKDCFIEGTVDFIFGSGKSIYLNTELHVLSGDPLAMITAQARKSNAEDNGYVFLHCKITGSGGHAFLGRSWFSFGKVVYAYTEMSDAVNPRGWSDNQHPADAKSLYDGEYKNTGPGADPKGRVGFTKHLRDADARPFLSLGYIEGSKWLLPLPKV